ncbi:Lactaldehyde reductase [Posidoniimonas polymericola]|uniref:Lactaldehyde reductase n=1 Tax=Posidoniimonas polymericola TaxID=2528002 RepID=A0A5C5YM54_9BACT|nr:iron-containing alcohol dehydrogenase [Posidoniimonas polymericola]TWT76041.1 Lactaldehyde reductase [Posidoniimonas polymericola]
MPIADSDAPTTWSKWIGTKDLTLVRGVGQAVHGGLHELPAALTACGATRVLAVVDEGAVRAAGVAREFEDVLDRYPHELFTQFGPNPTVQHAAAATAAAKHVRADCVVAVGGGSCLDVAKLAAVGVRQSGGLDLAAIPPSSDGCDGAPLIAAPTTSGSGSEATHFAVAYANAKKKSFAHPTLRPRHVLLDRRFALAMPPGLAAAAGLDALAQSLESRWAVGADERSIEYSAAAAGLIAGSLVESVTAGTESARLRMMIGAFLAGQAINRSKTTAAHAMSYQLTSRYKIPHGHAVALLLGWVGAANAVASAGDCNHPGGDEHVRRSVRAAGAWLGVAPAGLPGRVASLLEQLGLATNLRDAGVNPDDLASLAAGVDPTRLGNNPRRFTSDQLHAIYRQAWDGNVRDRTAAVDD